MCGRGCGRGRACVGEGCACAWGILQAFEMFVNQEPTMSLCLASFTNEALKKGSKIDQSEIDAKLANVVCLYGAGLGHFSNPYIS
jgi:hypothetical protein